MNKHIITLNGSFDQSILLMLHNSTTNVTTATYGGGARDSTVLCTLCYLRYVVGPGSSESMIRLVAGAELRAAILHRETMNVARAARLNWVESGRVRD